MSEASVILYLLGSPSVYDHSQGHLEECAIQGSLIQGNWSWAPVSFKRCLVIKLRVAAIYAGMFHGFTISKQDIYPLSKIGTKAQNFKGVLYERK